MKLYRLSQVRAGAGEMDSVESSKKQGCERHRAMDVLMEAQGYYWNMWKFRQERERNKRYAYGDQWGDIICYKGEKMTEGEYLLRQGNIPLKNNLIRRLIRNVIGVWSSQNSEPTCVARDRDEQKLGETMSTVLQYNMQLNRMNMIYARTMEEFLLSSLIVHKKTYGWRNDKLDCWTDVVQPNNFFLDTSTRDFRGWDVACLGEIHDLDFNTLCTRFAKSPEDYKRLSEIYAAARDHRGLNTMWDQWGYPDEKGKDFFLPQDPSKCRVIEVWRKEQKPRYRCHDYNTGEVYKIDTEDYGEMVEAENAKRLQQALRYGIAAEDVATIKAEWMMDNYWYYYYLSPLGDILGEGETPYAHKSHPYVFMAYPMIDGEVHSFTADIIDQQKYVNRLITLHDWIMRASAKGVLLVPQDCIPQGMSAEDFAESWSSVNGVIIYTPSKTGAAPAQVANNSTNIGIQEMLQLQLKFFEDISGVNGALQGKAGYSGMSAALYSQQTQNATTSLLDILDSFGTFIKEAAYKDVKNIQQYYDDSKVMNIAGRASAQIEYDPEKIRDVEFDLSIVPSTATPAYRAMANDFLMQIWASGQITLEQLLQVGSFSFADELLQALKSQKEQMQEGGQPQSAPPELLKRARQGADMGAVDTLQKALRRGESA